jgi:hypothetical protein
MILGLSWLSFSSTIIFYLFPDFPFLIFDCLCVFAPMFGYLDQLRDMWSSRSASKFKPDSSICFLFSNSLRVTYWIGHRFAAYLFWQSLFTLFVHTLLCHGYFHFREPPAADPSLGFSVLIHPFCVRSFVAFGFILALWLCLLIGTVFIFGFLIGFSIASELIGLISNLFDSIVTLPPFISVVVHSDASALTSLLVVQFVTATFLKAVLYLCRPTPWPFRVGVAVQGLLVFGITFQFVRLKWAEFRAARRESEQPEEEDDNSDVSF